MHRISPREGHSMNSVAYVERAAEWARLLEDKEVERSGADLAAARPVVARRTGVPEGTLRNLRKHRLKAIGAHWFDRLRAGVVKELEAELMRLEHDLAILRATGADPRHPETEAVVADIARARAALGFGPPPVPAERDPAGG